MTAVLPTDSALAAFGSSFTAITLAELGDKTFFMALILAARHRPRWVFIGAFAALTCVTVISLALGFGLRELLPQGLMPWLAAVLFLAFGVKLLLDAQAMGADQAQEEAEAAAEAVNIARLSAFMIFSHDARYSAWSSRGWGSMPRSAAKNAAPSSAMSSSAAYLLSPNRDERSRAKREPWPVQCTSSWASVAAW